MQPPYLCTAYQTFNYEGDIFVCKNHNEWYFFFNSVKSVSSFLKTGYSKREEFASLRSKFFLFRVDPFQKTIGMQEIKQKITKIISLLKLQNIDQVYQFTLKTVSWLEIWFFFLELQMRLFHETIAAFMRKPPSMSVVSQNRQFHRKVLHSSKVLKVCQEKIALNTSQRQKTIQETNYLKQCWNSVSTHGSITNYIPINHLQAEKHQACSAVQFPLELP